MLPSNAGYSGPPAIRASSDRPAPSRKLPAHSTKESRVETAPAHEAGVPGFSRGRVEPTGGPERKPDRNDPDGLPYKLEEQQRQHLEWIANAQDGQQRDRR